MIFAKLIKTQLFITIDVNSSLGVVLDVDEKKSGELCSRWSSARHMCELESYGSLEYSSV